MEFDGWMQTGLILLIMIGVYILIRRPLQRKKLFDLAAGRTKRRRQARFARKLLQHFHR